LQDLIEGKHFLNHAPQYTIANKAVKAKKRGPLPSVVRPTLLYFWRL
jgi:hypothetical protein